MVMVIATIAELLLAMNTVADSQTQAVTAIIDSLNAQSLKAAVSHTDHV